MADDNGVLPAVSRGAGVVLLAVAALSIAAAAFHMLWGLRPLVCIAVLLFLAGVILPLVRRRFERKRPSRG
jgi:hypothetical protein